MQVVQFDGWCKDFAPRVERIAPLAPATPTRTVTPPIEFLRLLRFGTHAPRAERIKLFYDPASPLDPNWRMRAACRGKGSTPEGKAMWFPGPGGAQTGKHYCRVCPVVRECAEFADLMGEEWGIWGGQIRHRNTRSPREGVAA